ncbi:MAG TPA: glutamyl-tRNA reductase [Blastocatellia bacterium]|nr:glutamyl-tRNA reductase [Blastocatellia bacterium]
MSILVVGLSHKTAPVEIRERLAFKEELLSAALNTLVDQEVVHEALIVSTCNRVEMIISANGDTQAGLERTREFLYKYHDLPRSSMDQYLYHHANEHAIKHVFRVAASLDSMVMGEPQILGQVKNAYAKAVETGTVGRSLMKLMQHAFSVAKRVRTETAIASNAVSISYVAVELAKKVFDDLDGKTVMLLGAGEMAELAMRHLKNNGAGRILVANRTNDRAKKLASELGGTAVPFENLYEYLVEADIAIVSTGAPDYVLTAAGVAKTIDARRHRPLFLIDIAVPRNIDPDVSKLDSVFSFDIDDLEAAVEANIRERQQEAIEAETLIQREVDQFLSAMRSMELGPAIASLKQQMSEVANAEFERNRKRLGNLSTEQEEAIKAMMNSLTNKLSHPLIMQLRQAAESGGDDKVIELCQNAYSRGHTRQQREEV